MWRYEVPPVGDNDTSVSGWMVFALKSAEEGGLKIDKTAYDGALSWLDEVTDTSNGRAGYEIEFDSSDLLDALEEDADLELWLISLDADGAPADVVSLGVVDAGQPGRHSLPAGLDPEVHFVVDISIEPRDGDELHSGRSILRGALA